MDKMEVLLDVSVVVILLVAGLHFYHGRQFLEDHGCEVYWTEFKDGYEGRLVNETELERFQQTGSIRPPKIQANLTTGPKNFGDKSGE